MEYFALAVRGGFVSRRIGPIQFVRVKSFGA
jgi:hypothetical protein